MPLPILAGAGIGIAAALKSGALGEVGNAAGSIVSGVGSFVGGLFGGSDSARINANKSNIILGEGKGVFCRLANHSQDKDNGGAILLTEDIDVPSLGHEDSYFNSKRNGENWHDLISSIEVAEGCILHVWEHMNYTGDYKVFGPGTVNLYPDMRSWNDKISSFKFRIVDKQAAGITSTSAVASSSQVTGKPAVTVSTNSVTSSNSSAVDSPSTSTNANSQKIATDAQSSTHLDLNTLLIIAGTGVLLFPDELGIKLW